MNYKVNEIFLSINGEGDRVGQFATFIRLQGCNLSCSYCDSQYACTGIGGKEMTTKEIIEKVKTFGAKNITITGGEPLQQDITPLIRELNKNKYNIAIETNGSYPIDELPPCQVIMDYKLPSSNMENKMDEENFKCLINGDIIKFVVGDKEDIDRAIEVIKKVSLVNKRKIKYYFSPIFGKIDPVEIINFLKERLKIYPDNIIVQLQLHKIIYKY